MAFDRAKETALYDRYLMDKQPFPLMGFPGENNKPDGNIVYQCFFPGARIALWNEGSKYGNKIRYGLNLYKPLPDDAHQADTLTDHRDRYMFNQPPIFVNDVVEAQLAIFYLAQKYLPTGVIHDICNAEPRTPAAEQRPVPDKGQTGEMRTDTAAGEAVE